MCWVFSESQAGTDSDVCSSCRRRLQIEELEARIALMPLMQAEQDRRWCSTQETRLKRFYSSVVTYQIVSLLQILADASRKPRRGSSYHEGRSRMEGKNEFFSEATALMSSWSSILNPKLSYWCRSFGFSNFSPRRSVRASSTQIAGWPPWQTSCSTSGPGKNWWTTDSASCNTSECCRIGFYHSRLCELLSIQLVNV